MQLPILYKERYQSKIIIGLFIIVLLSMVIFPIQATARNVVAENTADIIIVAIPKSFPPQYQLDDENKPSGFAIDVLSAVADIADFQVQYLVKDTWTDTFSALQLGEADLIPNLGISEKRKHLFSYTQPVETVPINIFVRVATRNIKGPNNLDGKKVVTVKGNISVSLLQSNGAIKLIIKNSVEDALFSLLSGEADAMVYPKPWTQLLAVKSGIDDHIKMVGPPIYEVKRAMAVRIHDKSLLQRLNKALLLYLETDAYKDVYSKWFAKPSPYWSIRRIVITSSVITLILILNLLLWHYRSIVRINNKLVYEQSLLRGLVDSLPDLIFYKNNKSEYIGCNKAFERFIGIEAALITGKTDYDFFPVKYADSAREIDKQIIETRQPCQTEEWVNTLDGRRILLDEIKTPYYSPNLEILGLIGIGRDITNQRQHEIQLNRIQKMDALGNLTGGIAHDFNNLLGVILGFAELLQMDLEDNPDLLESVNEIYTAATRGKKLTQNLLVFSSKNEVERSEADINVVLLKMKILLAKSTMANIKLEYNLQDGIWPVWLEVNCLEDTILNLVLNAAQAIYESGSITVTTSNLILDHQESAQYKVHPGEYVCLSIADTGLGMDETTQARIFEPFFTTKGTQGTGLGLSQVYGFVKRMTGTINVYSEPGHGSQIILYFPRYLKDEEMVENTG